jgi:hypothetical protein
VVLLVDNDLIYTFGSWGDAVAAQQLSDRKKNEKKLKDPGLVHSQPL